MAKGVNKVFLLGNVGKDPEMRSHRRAACRSPRSASPLQNAPRARGNWQDKTEWHNMVCFQRTAEIVRDYVKKGTQLFIEGRISNRSWEDKESGAKKYRTEILVNELTLLGKPGGGSGEGGGSYAKSNTAPYTATAAAPAAAPDFADQGITDDDIPF